MVVLAPSSRADIDPLSGIDMVTIGAVGNAPWTGTTPPTLGDQLLNRGRVDYEYRIGRFEITTRDWVGFMNAAFDRPQAEWIPWLAPPTFWGAVQTTPMNGGMRWSVPGGNEMRPVGNISWRMAAIFANWLHNDKRLDREAFLDGAYTVSQFGGGGFEFTDQLSHHPGARYWIPTWDEWIKAVHYDPNKNGAGQGGWWTYSNRSDTPATNGPPGVGEANYGWVNGFQQFEVLLGAYPNTVTPWGLLDAAGGTTEWTEGVTFGGQNSRARVTEGSYWGSASGFRISDAVFAAGSTTFPTDNFAGVGFRIASAVPPPPQAACVLVSSFLLLARRRRSAHV